MKNTTTFAGLMAFSFLATAVMIVPPASADATTVCPLGTPPCASVETGTTTGDGDCDQSNGSGSRYHGVNAWTGTFPVGNSSVRAENACTPAEDYFVVDVTSYTPLYPYPTKWVGFYWGLNERWCFSALYTGGRAPPNTYQDTSAVTCAVGGPPTLP